MRRIIRHWILVVLFAVAGALIAFFISLSLKPRYEAVAVISVNIDYGRTEILELVVEDRVLDRVWALIISDETMEQTSERLVNKVGPSKEWETIEGLRNHTRLDSRLSRWELIGIHSDPEKAALIANAWRDVVLARLDDAYEHAWRAQTIQGASFDVTCVFLLDRDPPESYWQCISVGPEISEDSAQLLKEEVIASHGIQPIITYEPIQRAIPPEQPVLWPRGLLILSGGFIGFIVGVILTQSRSDNSIDDSTPMKGKKTN